MEAPIRWWHYLRSHQRRLTDPLFLTLRQAELFRHCIAFYYSHWDYSFYKCTRRENCIGFYFRFWGFCERFIRDDFQTMKDTYIQDNSIYVSNNLCGLSVPTGGPNVKYTTYKESFKRVFPRFREWPTEMFYYGVQHTATNLVHNGNGKKLSCSQAQLGQPTCLAVA